MGLIAAIIIGFVIGALAKFIMPGRDPGGFLVTALIGIVGSSVAHFLGRTMGMYAPNEPAGFIASILGAVILLAIYRLLISNRSIRH